MLFLKDLCNNIAFSLNLFCIVTLMFDFLAAFG